MQARVDSLTVNQDMVSMELGSRIDQIRTQLGGDEGVEKYFNKPMFKLRQGMAADASGSEPYTTDAAADSVSDT